MHEELIKALKTDKHKYRLWQSKIAMAFFNEYLNSSRTNDIGVIANIAAKNFLNDLIQNYSKKPISTKKDNKKNILKVTDFPASWDELLKDSPPEWKNLLTNRCPLCNVALGHYTCTPDKLLCISKNCSFEIGRDKFDQIKDIFNRHSYAIDLPNVGYDDGHYE